jgi:hypothetical protein
MPHIGKPRGKFFYTYSPPKLNLEDIENLSRPVTNNE